MCMRVYRNTKINLTSIVIGIEINLLTQMFRENERKLLSGAGQWGLRETILTIRETLLSRWWRPCSYYIGADWDSYYKLADLVAAGVDRQCQWIGMWKECEWNVSDHSFDDDDADPALTTALTLANWLRLSWPNLQQHFRYYYCWVDERRFELFGNSEQFYACCQNWIWPRFDLWGPSCRNVNRAVMEIKWSWNRLGNNLEITCVINKVKLTRT